MQHWTVPSNVIERLERDLVYVAESTRDIKKQLDVIAKDAQYSIDRLLIDLKDFETYEADLKRSIAKLKG
jgi:hypothetical protein